MTTYEEWMIGRGLASTTIQKRLALYRERARAWETWDQPPERLASWLAEFDGWTRLTYHSYLTSIYEWLVATGSAVVNPMPGIKKPPSPRPRPRPLTDRQLDDVLTTATPRVRAYLLLGYLAGLRAHEIAKMHGRDITETGLFVLGKGQRSETLPTHPLLWELAQAFPRDGYWFPSPVATREHVLAESVTVRVSHLFRSLGIEGATHRARHTYATTLLRGGANLRVVQELMRHSSLATTALYLGVDEDERRAAILGLVA